jgi:hypothetical protein
VSGSSGGISGNLELIKEDLVLSFEINIDSKIYIFN